MISRILCAGTVALVCVSCISPVRTNYFPDRPAAEERKEEAVRPPQLTGIRTADAGRRDTLVLDYTTPLRSQTGEAGAGASLPVTTGMSVVDLYEETLARFDEGRYDVACPQFRTIVETLPPGDSLAYEARFMEAECEVVNNRLVIALSTLIALSLDTDTPVAVLEKALVRKGQVQCLLGEKDSAAETFTQFRNRFPNSPYLPLADCSAVE